jgi:hypothetical protein
MKLLDIPIGLLINFHEPVLKNGISRMILPGANQPEGSGGREEISFQDRHLKVFVFFVAFCVKPLLRRTGKLTEGNEGNEEFLVRTGKENLCPLSCLL